MNKGLNILSIIVSIVLTFILSIFILIYVTTINIKSLVNKDGISQVLNDINVVDHLKDSGVLWEDFLQLGDSIGLTEEQFERILNSNNLKSEIGLHIEGIISSSLDGLRYTLSKEDLQQILNVAIDEYNSISENKITNEQRNKVLNSIDEEMISNLNEGLESINLHDAFGEENSSYIKLVDSVLYGHFSLAILAVIIFIIGIIALIRFSYYKWLPYVSCSLIISSVLSFGFMLILSIIPMDSAKFLLPFKYVLVKSFNNSATVLLAIAAVLLVGYKYLKKYVANNKRVYISKEKIEDEKSYKKLDTKTILILVLALLLILLPICILIFSKGGHTITFDTNGGNAIPSLEVKNNQIINIPDPPERDGYIFIKWVDEDGNEVTKNTKIDSNMTIKAVWEKTNGCPKGCTPIGDGGTCTKTTTTNLITYSGCPSGTETVEKFCSSHKKEVTIGFGEDQTTEYAGILCDGNHSGFCVDYNGRYTHGGESCPAGYFRYFQSDSGLDAVVGCAKKYNKGGSGCPSGYTQSGQKCIKTETIKCRVN